MTPAPCTACSSRRSCPAFYDRDAEGLPRAWLARDPRVDAHARLRRSAAGRMLEDYVERIYAPTRLLT